MANNELELPTGGVTQQDTSTAPPSAAWTGEDVVEHKRAMEAEVGDDPLGHLRAGDLMGRHRFSAAVSRLEQEIQSLQEELEEVDRRLQPTSAVCEEVVVGVECVPDGLLPATCGPGDLAWDKWFQRVYVGRGDSSRGGGSGHRRGVGRRWWMQAGRRFLPPSSGEEHVEALAK